MEENEGKAVIAPKVDVSTTERITKIVNSLNGEPV